MIFFNSNPWFNACFKEVMYTTYFVLSYRLQTNFLHLFISILSGKNGKSVCKPSNILGYLISTSRIYPFLSFSL